ncbi:hypothetical protein ACVIW0_005764 [Bradyrhizobium sp. USDA 4454]
MEFLPEAIVRKPRAQQTAVVAPAIIAWSVSKLREKKMMNCARRGAETHMQAVHALIILSGKPVVVAVTITASVPRKSDNPALPVTPTEQIESTYEAFPHVQFVMGVLHAMPADEQLLDVLLSETRRVRGEPA